MRCRVPLPRGGEAAAAASETTSTEENLFYPQSASWFAEQEAEVDWDEQRGDHHDDPHLRTHDGERRGSSPTQRVLQRERGSA